MKQLSLILLLVWFYIAGLAQSVSQLEYFVDTDAGPGNNTLVNLAPVADGSFSFTVNVAGIPIGYHKLYIRTRDSDGNWSLTSRRNIEVASLTTKNVVAAEYFYDTDPGIGNAVSITVISGADLTQNFITNTSALSPGYHKLYIRTLDTDGNWSLTSRRNIEVPFPEGNGINAAEYFIDTDPGVGNGTIINLSAQSTDSIFNFNASTAGLAPGYHKLYIRTQDLQGKWSLTSRRNTEIQHSNGNYAVIGVEYSFGTDPGAGNAPYIVFATPAADGSFSFTIPQAQVPNKKDSLYLRVRDSTNKNWSITQWTSKTFSTPGCTLPDQPSVKANDSACAGASANYSIPLVAGATAYTWTIPTGWTIVKGQGTDTISLTAPVVQVATPYSLSVAIVNACGTGTARTFTVTVNPLPVTPTLTAAGPTAFCAGDNVVLRSSAATGNRWLKDGVVIAGAVDASYTATAAGSYTVMVTNASGCTALSAPLAITLGTGPAVPVISTIGGTAICNGNSLVLTSSAASGNQWIKDGNDIGGAAGNTYTATAAGAYSVRVSNGGSCTAVSAITTVTVNTSPPVPVITAGGPTTFCAGGNVVLTSSAGTGNQWLKDAVAVSAATNTAYTATAAGSYSVRVTNAGGCTALSAPAIITVNPAPPIPVITASGPTSFCAGGNVVLTSSAATGNQWVKDAVVLSGITTAAFPVNAAGVYSVQVTNAAGCTVSSSNITITVSTVPPKPVITQNGNQLSSSATTGNQWFKDGVAVAGATAQTYTATQAGDYTVQVTLNGCASPVSDKLTVVVTAVFDPVLVSAVNVFPNPASSVINIINNGIDKIAVVVYDMTGKKLAVQEHLVGAWQLPVAGWSQGCYLLYISSERTKKSFYKLVMKE